MAFYRNGEELTEAGLRAVRPNGDSYTISDDKSVLEFYLTHREDSARDLINAVCANESFWGEDLTKLPGFADLAADMLEEIEKKGTYEVMRSCL